MMIKYRVSDVAKDFGKPNKEIAEILGAYLQAPKSNAQALKEPELDVIFEYLTQKNQAESLDALFAPAAEAAQKRRQQAEQRMLEKQKKENEASLKKERAIQEAILTARKKYGKNAILKGMNLEEGATTMERNHQIGGHKA